MLLNVAACQAKGIPVLLTFLAPFGETPLNSEEKGMSDNIRNKGIFEIKIAQNLPKFDILKNDSNVTQWERFC